MAIATYTELVSAIGRWLNRSDLTDSIPDFIALAEAQIARRLRRFSVRAALTLNAQAVNLPPDCAELRSIRLDSVGLRGNIKVTTPEGLADYRSEGQGPPRAAAVLNGQVLLDRVPDQDYASEIIYYATLTPLSDAVASNPVLDSAPDVYLFGSLKEAAPFLQDDDRVPLWESKFASGLDAEELARERMETGAGLRPVRLPVVFG